MLPQIIDVVAALALSCAAEDNLKHIKFRLVVGFLFGRFEGYAKRVAGAGGLFNHPRFVWVGGLMR